VLFGSGISGSENTFAIFTAIDIIKDVESQVAVITLWTDDIGLFVEGVLVVKPIKQDIKHQRDSSLKWDSEWDSSISVNESQGLLTSISTNEETPKTLGFRGSVV
jgi:hypothetical protein